MTTQFTYCIASYYNGQLQSNTLMTISANTQDEAIQESKDWVYNQVGLTNLIGQNGDWIIHDDLSGSMFEGYQYLIKNCTPPGGPAVQPIVTTGSVKTVVSNQINTNVGLDQVTELPIQDLSQQPTIGETVTNESTVDYLNDPELQMAEDWYLELNCPDMNIDCIEGIDTLQTNIQRLYSKIQDNCRDDVQKLELKIAEFVSEIANKFNQMLNTLEENINTVHDKGIYNIETQLYLLEDHIRELTDEMVTINESLLQENEEKTNETNIEVNEVPSITRVESISTRHIGQVDEKYVEILQSCCDKLSTLKLTLDQSQIDQIVNAIKSITINVVNNETKVEKVDNMVCEDEYPSDEAYKLSTCYENDLKQYEIRTNFVEEYNKAKSRDISKQAIVMMEE